MCAGVRGRGEKVGGGEDADGFGDAGAENLQVGGQAGFDAVAGGGVGVGVERVKVAGDVGLEGGCGGVFELGLCGGGFSGLGEGEFVGEAFDIGRRELFFSGGVVFVVGEHGCGFLGVGIVN